MTDFLISGPEDAVATLLLAHGAGAGMESPFMVQMAALLADRGVRTLRFEFGYMAARRNGGKRKPPPRAQLLSGEHKSAVTAALDLVPRPRRLFIGGKSMGGRVASFVADELFQAETIRGLVCIGYPFHPPKKPDQLRTDHLVTMGCPALIVQGVRDPFGTREEVESYPLPTAIRYHWADDGDHDLGPRGASGFTRKGNLAAAADAIAAFVKT
jgi:predicted alpha/beta-hydrolase family hydrolase